MVSHDESHENKLVVELKIVLMLEQDKHRPRPGTSTCAKVGCNKLHLVLGI